MTAFQKIIYTKDAALFGFIWLCFLVLNHAGSLIMAGIAALGGLVGVLGHRVTAPTRWPLAVWLGLIFVAWASLSAFGSPYDDPRDFSNAARFALGLPLYGLFIYALAMQHERLQNIWAKVLMIFVALSAVVFLIDFLSGYGVTRLGVPNALDGDIEKNLGHGVSVLVISLPAILLLWAGHKSWGMWVARALIVIAGAAFVLSGNAAVLLALISALIAMVIAIRAPKFAIKAIFILPAALILISPLLALASAQASAELKASIPFSWEWRLETWGYLWDKIKAAPLIGHGFDSLRSFTDTFDARGFKGLSLVPMHPHNIGLHIWTETGLIGVALICAALVLGGRAIAKAEWLTRERAIAITGSMAAITVIANLSYSAWQDWWLGAVFIALALPALIKNPVLKPR